MKKVLLLSAFVLGVLVFSCEKVETPTRETVQAKSEQLIPLGKKYFYWVWTCHVCKKTGTCLCREGFCVINCPYCATTLNGNDWSSRICEMK